MPHPLTRRVLLLLLASISALPAAEAKRIISTAPSITETIFAIGLGPRLVADSIYCKYPAEAERLPKIGTLLKPDVEAMIALHPDLVVVEKQPNRLGEQLARLHVNYVEFSSQNLRTIFEGARAIGRAAGAETNAQAFIDRTQTQLNRIEAAVQAKPHPTVAFIVGHNTRELTGMIAGGGHSYFSDLIHMAGAADAFADSKTPYFKVSLEEVLGRNPDFILEMSGESDSKQAEIVRIWQQHSNLKAVREKHVFAIPPGPFLIPGPRAVEAATQLLHLIHPGIEP